ncbi:uncharacterized protein LOC120258632 [Dioscorea cayenensis subsp. rotundata]|uniref:Uncharacterized protein LOC120258632 n=1 Tax=Dioscorea cayennensis subsp. rotundata TaxID=55577 RepID=A0AB40B4Q7_DIOCR|nr:uncharacterized protein LOC120258632 [Dioscorea cayenensis subsp. rotundata]
MDVRTILNVSLVILASIICLEARVASSRSVVFFDGSQHRYIRSNPSDGERKMSSISAQEVAATVSVLLGFAPSPLLDAKSSSKLNEILLPSPFDRPRAVFAMEVRGTEDSLLSTDHLNSLSGNTLSTEVHGSSIAAIELPGDAEISVVPLDESISVDCDASCLGKEFHILVSMLHVLSGLGGSFVGSAESFDGELKVPLASGATLSLQLTKKADLKFVLSVASLVRNIKNAVKIHEDISQSSVNPAELLFGRFMGIEALKEEYGPGNVVDQGVELLQTILIKLFDLLQKSYGGKIAGVILCDKETYPDSKAMLELSFSPRTSRLLEEDSLDVSKREVLLVRRSLAWITGVILLVSTFIGIYLLLNMPLTRDTLLYSNVKLD